MARFHFSLSSLVAGFGPHAAVARRTLAALERDDEIDPGDAPKGPGWFDSSFDLRRGLEVSEGLPGDAGLHEWLGVYLRSEREARPGSKPARARPERRQPVPAESAAELSIPALPLSALPIPELPIARLSIADAVPAPNATRVVDSFADFGIEGLELL